MTRSIEFFVQQFDRQKWHRLALEFPEHAAPGDTVKRFATLIVRRTER